MKVEIAALMLKTGRKKKKNKKKRKNWLGRKTIQVLKEALPQIASFLPDTHSPKNIKSSFGGNGQTPLSLPKL